MTQGGDEGQWWPREMVTLGNGEEGRWGREVVTKGCGYFGKRWRRECGDFGKWWRREVVTMGVWWLWEVVTKGVWWFWEVVTKGSGGEGKWWGREVVSICKLENETSPREVLNFWSWQHQKRSNSVETSSMFYVDNIENEKVLRDFLQKWKVDGRATASYQCVLRFFHSVCVKCCACHEKVMPGHTKCCTCHAKSSQQTWRSDAPKRNPSQEISALNPLTSLMNMSLVLRRPRASLQILFKWTTLAIVFGNATNPSRYAHFWQGAQSLVLSTQNDKRSGTVSL